MYMHTNMITNTNLSLGVRAVEETHDKLSNQKSNKNQLEMEVNDAEKRLAAAKKGLQSSGNASPGDFDMWKCNSGSSSSSKWSSDVGYRVIYVNLTEPFI